MRFEFLYVVLAAIFSVVYYFIQKKYVFNRHHPHSKTLIKGMHINLAFNVIFFTVCLLMLLVIDGAAFGLKVKYATDFFVFLLRTPHITVQALIIMYIAVLLMTISTFVVGVRIKSKKEGHKNLKLEKILISDFAVCAVLSIISFIGLVFIFMVYA